MVCEHLYIFGSEECLHCGHKKEEESVELTINALVNPKYCNLMAQLVAEYIDNYISTHPPHRYPYQETEEHIKPYSELLNKLKTGEMWQYVGMDQIDLRI